MKNKMLTILLKKLNTEPNFKEKNNQEEIDLKKRDICRNYEDNLEVFKSIFSVPRNADIKVREFTIRSINRRAFIIFISTMVDVQNIQEGIIEKLIRSEQSTENIQDIVSYPIQKTITI